MRWNRAEAYNLHLFSEIPGKKSKYGTMFYFTRHMALRGFVWLEQTVLDSIT